MAHVTVIVSWIPHAKGGRTSPPVPPDYRPDYWYSTLARFDSDPMHQLGAWSLVLIPKQIWNDGRLWVAEARFLSEEAPLELLKPGSRFEMLEGKRVVLHGMVADPKQADALSPAVLEDMLLV